MLRQFCLANLRLSSYFRISKHLQHFIKLFHDILPNIKIGTQTFDLQGKLHSSMIWILMQKKLQQDIPSILWVRNPIIPWVRLMQWCVYIKIWWLFFHNGAYHIFSVIVFQKNFQQLWITGPKLSPCNSSILQYYRLAPGKPLWSLCSQGFKALLIW